MTPASLLKFLNAARNLAKQGFKQEDIIKFAKQEFGEVTDLVKLQINKIFKTKNQPTIGKKDPVFDNTVETIPFDDTGTPFNPKDPQKVYGKPREGIETLDEADKDIADIQNTIDDLNKTEAEADAFSKSIGFPTATKKIKNREMTPDEYDDFVEEVGGADQLEAYNFDGTVGDAKRILKEQEDHMKYMYDQYKTGKLDPVAGDTSPARKRFLEKKYTDMEASGDKRLMTREEIEELSTFDLNDDIDISQGMIDLDEMNFTKNAQAAKKKIDNMDVNKEIKEGVASIMKDTSPAALKKSIEVDDLMLKYPGMDRPLAEQIATEINPRKKADIIAMVEQTIKMSEEGKSGSEIIDIFKKTPRTEQAKGGRIKMAKGGLPNILGF